MNPTEVISTIIGSGSLFSVVTWFLTWRSEKKKRYIDYKDGLISTISSQEATVKMLGETNTELWGEITKLREENGALKNQINALQNQITALQSQITALQSQIASLYIEIDSLCKLQKKNNPIKPQKQ